MSWVAAMSSAMAVPVLLKGARSLCIPLLALLLLSMDPALGFSGQLVRPLKACCSCFQRLVATELVTAESDSGPRVRFLLEQIQRVGEADKSQFVRREGSSLLLNGRPFFIAGW